jgi:hypothetical protein
LFIDYWQQKSNGYFLELFKKTYALPANEGTGLVKEHHPQQPSLTPKEKYRQFKKELYFILDL